MSPLFINFAKTFPIAMNTSFNPSNTSSTSSIFKNSDSNSADNDKSNFDKSYNNKTDTSTDTFTDTAAYSSFTPSAPTAKEFYRSVKAFDEARPSCAGEHAMVCGAGVALLLLARIARASELRLLVGAAGIALLARSASGRDGYVQKAKDALL